MTAAPPHGAAPPGRRSGLLLHPTSLPGPLGVGDLGPEAHRFVDFLAAAGQRVWQVLPLGPTGFGDSPYQATGAFAGNPLLVSPDALRRDGLLAEAERARLPDRPEGPVDYGEVLAERRALLAEVAARFPGRASPVLRAAHRSFLEEREDWLPDLALFLALKEAHGGAPWWAWPPELARREPAALRAAASRLRAERETQVLAQFLFHRQWTALRERCRERGIALLGDLPIYVAHDSAEVWARPHLFQLDAGGRPQAVAGVPPDYFSATGQLWGNPLYRWEEAAEACRAFFAERSRAALRWVDELRLDHFRGLEAYWAVPAGAATAAGGAWRPGPGAALLEHLARELGRLPLVAENLGVITPAVEALRHRFGLPGMAVLQFAFGTDPMAGTFRPHAFERDLVAYTGTHDNDTAAGWWASAGGDSTRSAADVVREKELARRYLDTNGSDMPWVLWRALQASVARTAIAPVQDVLSLGSEARMNRPGTASGNWRWRLRSGQLDRALAERLAGLSALFDRS